ncbi:MAG: hypothetical protein KGN16_19415 [Burkholderiales bacterium]|nr:hypothetical protein [Burkholderiales bacterium]
MIARACLVALGLAAAAGAARADDDHAFERDLYKTGIEQEIQFRAAAIQVAWGAEALCDKTTEVEPFVLLSVHSLHRALSPPERQMFREVTGLDEHWRVVWADESAPDELHLHDVVTAIDGRALPGGETHFSLSNLVRRGSVVSNDDQGFWDVLLQAREDAAAGKPMVLTLEGGRRITVETQRGCAGSVTASAFDKDPDVFWRQGNQRAKIPANAMIAARNADEFRWLAAFGTYFQASQGAIDAVHKSDNVSNGFLVGKILALTIPGAGMVLTAAEAQAEQAIAVDSIVGSADLFANEVVASLGGDPAAGLRLSERMLKQGMKVDAVLMDDLRRSNSAEDARRIQRLQAAQAAQAEREAAEARRK